MPKPVIRQLAAFLNTGLNLSALVATSTELNKLSGATPTTAEINTLTGVTATKDDLNLVSTAAVAATIGAIKATSGLSCVTTKLGNFFRLDFTFVNVAVTHTDAGASGSSGSLELYDFVQGGVLMLGSRSDLVITADNVLDSGTTLAMVYGFGSVACDAGDAALTGTEVDYAAVSGTLTASAHVCTSASLLKGAGTAKDGTATAAKIFFNESASAATSVANGTLTVNGTVTFVGTFLGDD